MAEATFRAPVRPSGRGGGHLVDVPPEVVDALCGPPSTAFRTEARSSGWAAEPSSACRRRSWPRRAPRPGDTLTVVVRNDDAPREIGVPEDLGAAFRANAVARRAFEGLSFSHRREYVRHITEAKRPDTRARRIERVIEALVDEAGSKGA